jgi:hypothetical protein
MSEVLPAGSSRLEPVEVSSTDRVACRRLSVTQSSLLDLGEMEVTTQRT